MGIFDDASLDERVSAIIIGSGKRTLSDASLEAAALLGESPSQGMIEGYAEWIEIANELAAAGLSPLEILRVCVRATTRAYKRKEGPSTENLTLLFGAPAMQPYVQSIVDDVSASSAEHASLRKMILEAAAAPPITRTTPTERARTSLELSLRRHRQSRAVRTLPSFVEWAYVRRIAVAAPELRSMETWTAASSERQNAIATAVADAMSKHLDKKWRASIESYGGPPIAVVACGAQRMSVVAGGTVEVGFSEEEEAAVRASAEVNAGCKHHYELYDVLFDNVDVMRPVVRAAIGPMIVAQSEPEALELNEAHRALVESLFRVPSEAEWEYLARGGMQRELTYRGDAVPDTRDEYLAALAGAETANAFGLWGFGLQPEICADVWTESHDDLPRDGSPRRGDGPRVVRGGAAQLSPWQGTGEWHLLLTAFRAPQTIWKHAIATRYVLGIDCGMGAP